MKSHEQHLSVDTDGAFVGFPTGVVVGLRVGLLVGDFDGTFVGFPTGGVGLGGVGLLIGEFVGFDPPPSQLKDGCCSLSFTALRRGVDKSGMRSPLSSQMINPFKSFWIT